LKAALLAMACLILWFPGGSRAGGNLSEAAERAARKLDEAALSLQGADSAKDRVAALTEAIRAYEAGLQAMREGLRRAVIRERAIRLEFESRAAELSQLLAALEMMEATRKPVLLFHPEGPLGTVRAGMLLSEAAPALQNEAAALRARLEELSRLRRLRERATGRMEQGLREVQQARTQLSQAISQRTDLPRRFAEDPVRIALLLEGSNTLDDFADQLLRLQGRLDQADAPDFEESRGNLPLPVAGTLLRRFNEPDAAGVRRPGIVLATRPLALVTSPWPATIRYRGPLLDYGNVMILEPAEGYLLVLAGLDRVFGEIGQVVDAGAPVGMMGSADEDVSGFLMQPAKGAGAERSETLYMELRKDREPVNPAGWFGLDKE